MNDNTIDYDAIQITRYRTKRERRILLVVNAHGILTPTQIAALTGIPESDVGEICSLLSNFQDELESNGEGSYVLTGIGESVVSALR